MRIVEVPSYEFERIHGESNLNTWRDGLRVLRALAVERVNGTGRPSRSPSTRSRAAHIPAPAVSAESLPVTAMGPSLLPDLGDARTG